MVNRTFILPCSGMGINVDRCPAVVRALKAEEAAPSTDVQQLKAEIAAFANDLQCYIDNFGDDKKLLGLIVHGMRQLSAV